MKTATFVVTISLAALAVSLPGATAEHEAEDEDGSESRGSCITLVLQQIPPVMIDPDACLPIHN